MSTRHTTVHICVETRPLLPKIVTLQVAPMQVELTQVSNNTSWEGQLDNERAIVFRFVDSAL